MNRKHLLLSLGALLLASQYLLTQVSERDNLGFSTALPFLTLVVAVIVALTFVRGMRGRPTTFVPLALLFTSIGIGELVASMFAPNGGVQLAVSALLNIALAIVLLMLREEVDTMPDARWVSSGTQGDQEPVGR
jgi:hypothetical protein